MPEGDPTPTIEPTPGSNVSPPAGKTFTQEDVDRINAETRRKAEEAAAKRLLAELGIEDVGKGKELFASAKAAEEASKSELQRAQEENLRLKAQAEAAQAQARSTLVRSRVENALRDAGINPQRVEGAIRLAPLGDVKVSDDGSIAGIEEAVKAVKEASPEWFGAPGQPFSAPDASGGSLPPSTFDWRTATPEQKKREMAKLGLKPYTPARY